MGHEVRAPLTGVVSPTKEPPESVLPSCHGRTHNRRCLRPRKQPHQPPNLRALGAWTSGTQRTKYSKWWVRCRSWGALLAKFCTRSQQHPVAISSHGRTSSGARPAWAQVLSPRLSLLLLREGRQAPGRGAQVLRGISPVLDACAPATLPRIVVQGPRRPSAPTSEQLLPVFMETPLWTLGGAENSRMCQGINMKLRTFFPPLLSAQIWHQKNKGFEFGICAYLKNKRPMLKCLE